MEAKIADFGLSKAFNHDNTTNMSTNTLVGTPGYVDPEYVNLLLFINFSPIYFLPWIISNLCNLNS